MVKIRSVPGVCVSKELTGRHSRPPTTPPGGRRRRPPLFPAASLSIASSGTGVPTSRCRRTIRCRRAPRVDGRLGRRAPRSTSASVDGRFTIDRLDARLSDERYDRRIDCRLRREVCFRYAHAYVSVSGRRRFRDYASEAVRRRRSRCQESPRHGDRDERSRRFSAPENTGEHGAARRTEP